MTRRAFVPADLGPLSGCAAELAEAFVSLASDIALVIDDDGVIRSVAQSAAAPMSAQAGAWVGRRWVDTVSGDTRRKVELMFTDLKATGIARRREVNLVGALAGDDGGTPVAFSALRLGASGPVLAVGKDLRAVSAIQQRFLDTQQELERGYWRARQAESRYRLLFQVATDAVLTADAHSLRVIEANHAAAELLGAGLALHGRTVPELFDTTSRGLLREWLSKVRASAKAGEMPARLAGSHAAVALSATPFRAGDGQRLLLRVRAGLGPPAPATDINKTLALLVDNTRDGVVVSDSAGRIVIANPAFLALVGEAGEEQVCGRPVGDWLGRIDADVSALLAGAHGHGIAHLVRSSLRGAGGMRLDVDVTAALLVEGEQECFGFTLRVCEPRAEGRPALAQGLAALERRVGQVPLAELMARAASLIEQQFMRSAVSQARGDTTAAAALLGIDVATLLHELSAAADPAEIQTPREPTHSIDAL